MYGLSCGHDSDTADVVGWGWMLLKKMFKAVVSSGSMRDELYHCSLKWGPVVEVDFSVQAYECSIVENHQSGGFIIEWYSMVPVLVTGCMMLLCCVVDHHTRKLVKSLVFQEASEKKKELDTPVTVQSGDNMKKQQCILKV